ncbi:MAG: hypothetical protein IJI66_01755 [Erysipelotrichaceae bacterium]|nr:hypothetical protein [Erysipelotrichaceae bacterium]
MSKKKKKIQSTQHDTPVREIVNGVIITKDERYVKIIEVIPTPFFLKKISDQNKIYNQFIALLKSAPMDIQFKTVALPSNISRQLDKIEESKQLEKNEKCIRINEEYEQRLRESQKYGVTRRFFVIISYDKKAGLFAKKKMNYSEAVRQLNQTAERIIGNLLKMGNKVVTEEENLHQAEILYTLLNRRKSQYVSFDKNLEDTMEKYFTAYGNTNIYIPPTEYISPRNIVYTGNRILVDGMYYGYMIITSDGYPKDAWPGWLSMFINSEIGVDVDIFLRRMNKEYIQRKLSHNAAISENDAVESGKNTVGFLKSRSKYYANSYLLEGLESQDFYNVAVLITVCDEDPQMLNRKMEMIYSTGIENSMEVIELKQQAEDAFRSALPLNRLNDKIYEKTMRNMLSEGAGTLYPFTSFQINDENGIYFGDDKQTGALALIDIYDPKRFMNANGFIASTTGGGKTFLLCLIAVRLRIIRIPITIILPAKADEVIRLCKAMDGSYVDFGEGSSVVINIMEIHKRDEKAKEMSYLIDGGIRDYSLLMKKISTIKAFFEIYLGKLDMEEKAVLDSALIKTYERFGITADNESLWADETHTRYKEMPVLDDLKETLYEMKSPKILIDAIRTFTEGSASFFNGKTNVDIDNDFLVYALDGCSKELLPLAIYTVMDFCWSKIMEDRTKKKMLMIDEWWIMAHNHVAAEYSLEISKLIRAYSGAFWVATQQMTDIMAIEDGKYGKPVINNSAIKILKRMEDDDLEATSQLIKLSERETQAISDFDITDALFIAGNNRMSLRVTASKTEYELITNRRDDLQRIAAENRKKIEEIEEQNSEEYNTDLNDLLLTKDDYSDVGLISTNEYISNWNSDEDEEDEIDLTQLLEPTNRRK